VCALCVCSVCARRSATAFTLCAAPGLADTAACAASRATHARPSPGQLTSRNSITPSRAFLTSGVSVLTFMPGPAGMAQEATGLGTFSTCVARDAVVCCASVPREATCAGCMRRCCSACSAPVAARSLLLKRQGGHSHLRPPTLRLRRVHHAARCTTPGRCVRRQQLHPAATPQRHLLSAPPRGTCGSCPRSTAAGGSRTCNTRQPTDAAAARLQPSCLSAAASSCGLL
jgi:hypothetical protein